jgi:hypothetical protein
MLQLPRGINNLPEGSTLLMLWQGLHVSSTEWGFVLVCVCVCVRARLWTLMFLSNRAMAALNQKQEQEKREVSAEQWMSSSSLSAHHSNAVYDDMADDQRALDEVWDDDKGCVIHMNSYSLSQPARNVPLDSAGNRPSAESWVEESGKELTSGNNSAVKQQSFLNFGQKPQQQDKMPQALKRSGNMQKFLAQVCRRLLHLHFRSSSLLFPH